MVESYLLVLCTFTLLGVIQSFKHSLGYYLQRSNNNAPYPSCLMSDNLLVQLSLNSCYFLGGVVWGNQTWFLISSTHLPKAFADSVHSAQFFSLMYIQCVRLPFAPQALIQALALKAVSVSAWFRTPAPLLESLSCHLPAL